jgi:hypothetical protein
MKIKSLIAAAVKAGRYSVDRFVRLVYCRFHRRMGLTINLPLYRSMAEPDLPLERGWERWECIFCHVYRAALKRGMLGKEPRFYRWRYDGRVRWKLWITEFVFWSWGRSYEDLPNSSDHGWTPSEHCPDCKTEMIYYDGWNCPNGCDISPNDKGDL